MMKESDLKDKKEYFYNRENEKYIQCVKNNLISFLSTTKYASNAELKRGLEAQAMRGGYHPLLSNPDNKLSKLLGGKDHLDPYFINEICKLCNFPLEKVYSGEKITPEKAAEIMADLKKDVKQKPFAPLSKDTHGAYFGEFYGYTVEHNPNEPEEIIKFRLSISEDENLIATAEYTFSNKAGKKHVFTGTPYYLSDLETVVIEMTANSRRRYQCLYFNGDVYSSDSLTYKTGVCVRTSTACVGEPDVKSFVITANELPEHVVENVIPGLLKMIGDDCYVTAAALEKLKNEDTDIKRFCESYYFAIELIDNSVYLVREYDIFARVKRKGKSERLFVFECLAKIRTCALAPNRILYRHKEAEYNYFQQLSQTPAQSDEQ